MPSIRANRAEARPLVASLAYLVGKRDSYIIVAQLWTKFDALPARKPSAKSLSDERRSFADLEWRRTDI
jgi:hypothetical protein